MRKFAFTLIELLVVIAIIAILAALLLPVLAKRDRSVSMNQWVGGSYAGVSPMVPRSYVAYRLETDFRLLSPASAWVFIDEHPDWIRFESFPIGPDPAIASLPASYHNGAGCLQFADNHAEIKRWLSPQSQQPVKYQARYGNTFVSQSVDYQ